MPSAKARAAKAVVADRIAAANAAAALAAAAEAAVASGCASAGVTPNSIASENILNVANGNAGTDANIGANTPLQPALPSMLNLNTMPNLSRALSVGAVTKLGANRGTANAAGGSSDEENVQPPPGLAPTSVSAKYAADKDVDDAMSMSILSPSSRPLSPSHVGGTGKDLRAYELERQRVKRTGELAKRKAKKASIAAGRAALADFELGKKGRGRLVGGGDMDVDVEEVKTKVVKPTTRLGSGVIGASPGIQVSLAELIVPSQRKPRKIQDDDFELIPPVRSVIALNDMVDVKDMDLDESWEFIEVDSVDKGSEHSYAAILAGR